MSDFRVFYLGVGSATPSLRHQPSCQVIDFRSRLFMVDCGEGAQIGMRRMKLKFSRLEHVFISHLHGDHFFGLPGLLSTMALHEVGGSLTVHFPAEGVDWLIDTMDRFCKYRSFDINIEPIPSEGGLIFEDNSLTVEAIPLNHRIPCTGFVFREKPRLRSLKKDMVEWLDIPIKLRHGIKEGNDYITDDGRVFKNEQLTIDPAPAKSYAYCSDTRFEPKIASYIGTTDVLYHESTYLEQDRQKADERFHSTAADAVRMAALVKAKVLVLGHYSKSYPETQGHLDEANEVAQELCPELKIICADEGLVLDI